jgi:four helix bundle protein
MKPVYSFRDLVVWQKSMQLAKAVYSLARSLPPEEKYALSDQMRRAVVSIPANIAEGQSRRTTKDFVHFLYIARGSNSELMTHLLLAQSFDYVAEKDFKVLEQRCNEVGRLLNLLIGSLEKR